MSQASQPKPRRLTCNCCGRSAGTFRQWWNQDTGYGQCGRCSDWSLERGESLEHIREMAGRPGIHRPLGPLESLLRDAYPDCESLDLAALRQAVADSLDRMGQEEKAARLRAKLAAMLAAPASAPTLQ